MQNTDSSAKSTAPGSGTRAGVGLMYMGTFLGLSLMLFIAHSLTSQFKQDMAHQNKRVESSLRSAEMPESQVLAISTWFERTASRVSLLVWSSIFWLPLCAFIGFGATDYRLGKLERQIKDHTPAIKVQAPT